MQRSLEQSIRGCIWRLRARSEIEREINLYWGDLDADVRYRVRLREQVTRDKH